METVLISRAAYGQMLQDQGIAVLAEERKTLKNRNDLLAAEMRANARKITALTSTIAALQLHQGA